MIVGVFVLPEWIVGITDASITRRPSSPITRRCGSTTASGSCSNPFSPCRPDERSSYRYRRQPWREQLRCHQPTARNVLLRTKTKQRFLLHQTASDPNRIGCDTSILVVEDSSGIIGFVKGLAERNRMVPRDVGRRLQAATVIAGKRCNGITEFIERERLDVKLNVCTRVVWR